ncbi:MAG: VWA domain-containing protein [Bradymonadia bacterium]
MHAWPLFLIRSALILALTGLIAGITLRDNAGLVILTDGPLDNAVSSDEQTILIRAGHPPSVVADGESIAAVDAEPRWSAAASLGLSLASEEAQIRMMRSKRKAERVVHANARLAGAEVSVSALVAGDGKPTLVAGGRRFPLLQRSPDWFTKAKLPAGGAVIKLEGGRDYPLCIPGSAPLKVADSGWPPDVMNVLEVLPHVELVPAQQASWMVGQALPAGSAWAPFAPLVTHFVFQPGAVDSPSAPLRFADRLPAPGVLVNHWSPLPRGGEPLMLAGQQTIVDVLTGPAGQTRRFGFNPSATELPKTAAWPVLFLEASLIDRAATARCREVTAGETVMIATSAPVQLRRPDGTATQLVPDDGRIVLSGLDRQGLYRLEADGQFADLAVTPVEHGNRLDVGGSVTLGSQTHTRAVDRRPWLIAAGVMALLLGFVSQTSRARLLMFLTSGLLFAPLYLDLGDNPDVSFVLAVDTSSSMPPEETEATVQRLAKRLGERLLAVVSGGERVEHLGGVEGALKTFRGATRHGPLLGTAAEVAGENGAVILVSDGRAEDGPAYVDVPVFTKAVSSKSVDARIESASVIDIGQNRFIHVEVSSDRACDGHLRIGKQKIPVSLSAGQRQVVRSVSDVSNGVHLTVDLDVADDRLVENNTWLARIERIGRATGIAVGGGGAWLSAAGFSVTQIEAEDLSSRGAELADARALSVVDIAASRLPKPVRQGLARWVEAGGLLLLAGHQNAFALGGWIGTSLDELSALDSRPPRTDSRPVGVTVLIDRSGSQAAEAGGDGLDFVGRLAANMLSSLLPKDLVSVIAFAAEPKVMLPLTPYGQLETELSVPTLARGGTVLEPAFALALETLDGSQLSQKFVVLVSDGDFADRDKIAEMVRTAKERGVVVIAVGVGETPRMKILETLASGTSGVALSAKQRKPNLVFERSQLSGDNPSLGKGGQLGTKDSWALRVGGPAPSIGHRVRTQIKDKARELAHVDGEPVLAEWRVGRGRVISLATDVLELGSEQWASLLGPGLHRPHYGPQVKVLGDRLYVDVGSDRPAPVGSVLFEDEAGIRTRGQLTPSGPGQAWAPLPSGPKAILRATAMTSNGAVVDTVSRNYPSELRATGVDRDALAVQAGLTGARPLWTEADLQFALGTKGRGRDTRWIYLIGLLAFSVVLADAHLWCRRA